MPRRSIGKCNDLQGRCSRLEIHVSSHEAGHLTIDQASDLKILAYRYKSSIIVAEASAVLPGSFHTGWVIWH